MVGIKAQYPDHFRTVQTSGLHYVNGYPIGRDILIRFTEEKSQAIVWSLNEGVYINLAKTFSISGCLIQALEDFSLYQNWCEKVLIFGIS